MKTFCTKEQDRAQQTIFITNLHAVLVDLAKSSGIDLGRNPARRNLLRELTGAVGVDDEIDDIIQGQSKDRSKDISKSKPNPPSTKNEGSSDPNPNPTSPPNNRDDNVAKPNKEPKQITYGTKSSRKRTSKPAKRTSASKTIERLSIEALKLRFPSRAMPLSVDFDSAEGAVGLLHQPVRCRSPGLA
jgi:hypothetical protein